MTVTAMRRALTVEGVRRLGVPKTVMSDFEIEAALARDRCYSPPQESFSDVAYDRRGLLNILAWLAAPSSLKGGVEEERQP